MLEAEPTNTGSQETAVVAYLTPTQEDQISSRELGPTQSEDDNAAPVPYFNLQDVNMVSGSVTESGSNSQDLGHTPPVSPPLSPSKDIIVKGLVNPQEACVLLGLFQEHYARWVSFDKAPPTDVLLKSMRKSPLLMTACCLIAVR